MPVKGKDPKPKGFAHTAPGLHFCRLGLISFHFGLGGLAFLSFWPLGPCFPFVLPFWAFMSSHCGLLGLAFLLFSLFWPSFPFILSFWALISFHFASSGLVCGALLARRVASNSPHPQTTLSRNACFLARLVAATLRGCSVGLCWPAVLHRTVPILKRPLAETHVSWPTLWQRPSSIFKRPLAETDFLLARLVAAAQLHLQTTFGRTDILLARLVASTQLHPQATLGRNRYFAGPPCSPSAAPSSNDLWPKRIFCWPAL